MSDSMLWFKANGRMHLLKWEEPLTGHCNVQPIMTERPALVPYDPVYEVPPDPCRPCLMVAAMQDDVIDAEPAGFAKDRGVIPVDEADLVVRGVTFE